MTAKREFSPVEICDIVNSRFEKGANKVVAKKYNCGSSKIYGVWKEYYGGTKIEDAQNNGLIKELPKGGGGLTRNSSKFSVVESSKPVSAAATIKKAVPVRSSMSKPETQAPPKAKPQPEKSALAEEVEVEQGIINAGNTSGDLEDSVKAKLATMAITGDPDAKRAAKEFVESKIEEEEYEPSIKSTADDSIYDGKIKTEKYTAKNVRAQATQSSSDKKEQRKTVSGRGEEEEGRRGLVRLGSESGASSIGYSRQGSELLSDETGERSQSRPSQDRGRGKAVDCESGSDEGETDIRPTKARETGRRGQGAPPSIGSRTESDWVSEGFEDRSDGRGYQRTQSSSRDSERVPRDQTSRRDRQSYSAAREEGFGPDYGGGLSSTSIPIRSTYWPYPEREGGSGDMGGMVPVSAGYTQSRVFPGRGSIRQSPGYDYLPPADVPRVQRQTSSSQSTYQHRGSDYLPERPIEGTSGRKKPSEVVTRGSTSRKGNGIF
jgi:hypothetical protein